MNTLQTPTKLIHLIIRVPKEHSAFTYFTLESNEGLCFYSTLESSLNQSYRDIELTGPFDFDNEIRHLLKSLEREYPIRIILDEVIE